MPPTGRQLCMDTCKSLVSGALAAQDTSSGAAQMVTRETPVSRGRLATPQAPRDCPPDIIQLINDCTVLHPVRLPRCN